VIDGQFTYAWTKPDLNAPDEVPDLKAKTLFWTIGARYPLKRTQSSNLWVGGGFDFVDQKVHFFEPLSRDKLRVLWLRADWDAIDLTSRRPAWKANAQVELRKGLDIFDASDSDDAVGPSRLDGDSSATVLRASAQGELALGRDFAVAVAPRAQYAFDPLLSFEEFTAGNYTVGRGYDPAALSGESGVGMTVELRGPRLMPSRTRLSLQPYLFGDAAWVWNKNDGEGADHLKSAGGGVRAELSDRFRLDGTVAVPLEKTRFEDRKGDVRVLVTLTSRILP
jgi:hemolysin activation/secretion protein